MLTHYIILLLSINTLLSQIFASGWLLHHHVDDCYVLFSPSACDPHQHRRRCNRGGEEVVAGSLLGLLVMVDCCVFARELLIGDG